MTISTVKQQIRSRTIQCYIAYRWSRSPFSELNLRSQCTIVPSCIKVQISHCTPGLNETTVSTVGCIWIPDIKPVPRLPYKVVRHQTLCLSYLRSMWTFQSVWGSVINIKLLTADADSRTSVYGASYWWLEAWVGLNGLKQLNKGPKNHTIGLSGISNQWHNHHQIQVKLERYWWQGHIVTGGADGHS